MKKQRKRTPKGLSVKDCMTYMVKIDEDFILSDAHGYSLKRLLNENPNGIPNGVAQEMLGLPQEVYNEALRTAERTIRQHLEP